MTRYNFSAKTLDEAITKACVELGVTSDKLDYKIVEQGSAGILGIGARPWIIAACNKSLLEKEEEEAAKKAAEEKEKQEIIRKREEEAKIAEAAKDVLNKADVAIKEAEKCSPVKKEASEKAEERSEKVTADGKEIAEKAEAFLKAVFESIDMDVQISTSYDEMLSELSVDLSGEDMGVLIGKRGQTLDSLQYLTGQVINKHQSGYVRVKLDTENYRERRHETLENLAHNMAHKVRRTHHPMALEPMNPYERRIIHSTLQDEKDVTTRSEGEEPYRHVVICYVKHKSK